MSFLSLGGSLLDLAISVLKIINTKQARKYHDKLFELRLKKVKIDALPPEEIDDVAYVQLLKEIDITAEAALNDPALHSDSPTT